MEINNNWISCYIYCSRTNDEFLLKYLKVLVENLFNNNRINNFFFIRYYENGFHIRLRLKLEQKEHKRMQDFLLSQLNQYNEIFSENKIVNIVFREYEPEIERYGGNKAILVAEDQFQLSSTTILQRIGSVESWNYSQAIVNALILHLSFAYSTGLKLKEGIYFFYSNYENWAYADVKNTKADFENYFQKYKAQFFPALSTLWNALNENIELEDKWLNEWVIGMKSISLRLETIPYLKKEKLFSILESYVHMTNNRLGLGNEDEPLVSYMIYRFLNTLVNSQPA